MNNFINYLRKVITFILVLFWMMDIINIPQMAYFDTTLPLNTVFWILFWGIYAGVFYGED